MIETLGFETIGIPKFIIEMASNRLTHGKTKINGCERDSRASSNLIMVRYHQLPSSTLALCRTQ